MIRQFTHPSPSHGRHVKGLKWYLASLLMVTGSLLGLMPANAQSIQVGTGTSTTSTTEASAINIYYRSMHIQYMFTAAEINALGVTGPKVLDSLGFNVVGAPLYAMPNFSMKVGSTTATNLTSPFLGFLSTVYTNASYMPTAGGWNMLSLQNPYFWNGTDNLVLDVCFDQVNPTYNASGTVQYTSYSTQYGNYYRIDANPTCGITPNSSQYNRANTRMHFFTPPACSGTPSGITVTPTGPIASCGGATQMLIGSVTPATGYGYQWESSPTGAAPWTPIAGATNTYYTFSVTGNNYYHLKVTCANGGASGASNTVQVTATAPTYAAVPYFQDFESWQNYCSTNDVPSNNWTNQPSTGNNSWRRDDSGATAAWYSPTTGTYVTPVYKSGAHSARFHTYGTYLGSPATQSPGNLDLYLNCSASTGGKQLYFWYNNFPQYSYANDSLTVWVSTNGGSSFTQLSGYDTTTAWVRKSVPIASSSAQTIVRFQGKRWGPYDYSDILIDSVYVAPPCSGQPTAGALTPNGPISGCPGSFYTFNSVGTTMAGNMSYTWLQKANGTTAWIAANGTTTNNGQTFTTPSLYDTIQYRLVVTCLGSNLRDTTAPVSVNILRPTYAPIPFIEDFENWTNRCYTTDIPTASWANFPATGNSSWRRDDQGASANWTSATTGLSNPVSAVGAHSARFHGYYANTGSAGAGTLDAFLDCSTFTGNKELQFFMKTYSGVPYPNDSVNVLLSTNGGQTFTVLAQYGNASGSWEFKTLTVPSNSATTVIRFLARSDYQYYGDIAIDYVRVLPPCTGTPSAGNVKPILPCPNTDFQLQLINNSQTAGLTYLWQQSPDSINWSSLGITNGTQMIATGNISQPTYFRCIVTCTNSNQADTTDGYKITLAPFYYCYCNSGANYTSATDNIGNYTVMHYPAGDTILTYGPGSPLYNFTPIVTYTDNRNAFAPAPLYRDSTYTISLQQVESSTYAYTTRAVVFVDYNRNGVFEAAESVFYEAPTTSTNPALQVRDTFTVPDTAQIGITGMRVVLMETSGTVNPCGIYSYGETEDYLAEIKFPPCDGPTNPGIAISSDSAMCPGYQFTLYDSTHEAHRSGIVWVWQISNNNGGSWTDIANSTGKDTITRVYTGDSWFRLKMKCNITGDSTYSNIVHIGIKPPYKCYCYSIATGGAADTSDIGAFSIGNFVINSNGPHLRNPTATKGRTDYTDLGPIELYADTTYNVEIYHTMDVQTHADARITMFMDFNNNLQYDIPSERVTLTNNISTVAGWYVINNVTIPSAVIPNVPTGMRVILNNNVGPNTPSDDACGDYTSGETEDYVVVFRKLYPTSVGSLNNVQNLSLYPNPTGGKFSISFKADNGVKQMDIIVTNVTGQRILEQSFDNVGQSFTKDFDLTGRASGVYFVEMRVDGQREIRKIILR